MQRSPLKLAAVVFAVATITGCARCAPDQVGPAVARLTIRNVGALVSGLNADTTCGFASQAVLAAPVIQGEPGTLGSVTYTASNCMLNFHGGTPVSTDCNGNVTTASGVVTVSATRKISGLITGNPQQPVIPGGPDSVVITLTSTRFEDFEVTSSASDSSLRIISGSLTGRVEPRLAVSAGSGACAIATPNVDFSDIRYNNAKVYVTSPDNKFEVEVQKSAFGAQNGAGVSLTNYIDGDIWVWNDLVFVDNDGNELDPDFDAATFAAGYACTPDLATPVRYDCQDVRPKLADGAARLSVKMLGTLASLADANATCGFSSNGVLAAGTVSGTPGGTGELTLTVSNCTLTFPEDTELSPNCTGAKTIVGGTVTVSGTKKVAGRFTANPSSPIVPITDQPAQFDLEITAGTGGFKIGSSTDSNTLLAKEGSVLSGTVRPRVFLGASTGVCSVSTPHAQISPNWTGADLELVSSSGRFGLSAVEAALVGANGTTAGGTNGLSGTFSIGGSNFTVPSDGAGLDPAFEAAAFDSGWTCNPALASPLSSACGAAVQRTISAGAAALSIRTLGAVTSLIDANSSCGFSSPTVAGAPVISGSGSVGDDGMTATFNVDNCTIVLPADTVVSTDCLGGTTSVGGQVTVSGTKAVTGFLTGSSNPAEGIVPTSNKPAVFNLTLTFSGFTVKSSTSTSYLSIAGGQLAGTVRPRTGIHTGTGACSIATPNVTFSDVTWTNGTGTLVSNGNRFNLAVATSALNAQNGNDGVAAPNTLAGSITVDDIALTGLAMPLDPAFDQAVFDSTYSCNPNLVMVPNAACSFRQVLGGAAARLLAGATSVATSVGSNVCLTSQTFTGTVGQPGSATATATDCAVTIPAGGVNQPDCTNGVTVADGAFAMTTTRTTNPGLLLDTSGDGTADTIAPLSQTAVKYEPLSFAMDGWRFEKRVGTTPVSAITLTGDVAATTFTPVLAQADDNNDDVGDGVYTKRAPIFEFVNLTMPTGTATLVLQGKRFNVDLTGADLDVVVGAYAGKANSIAGAISVDGEPVSIAPVFDAAFTQEALDASYTCDPTVIAVPPN